MIDFNHRPTLSENLSMAIDTAMEKADQKKPQRSYLGASLLGHPCQRYLQFQYFHIPADKDFSGRTLRIFQRGHWGEAYMAKLLRRSGFTLRTLDKNKKQFGFSILDGRVAGHCDGVITKGPAFLTYPALWENKVLGSKYWKQMATERLKRANPQYYGQVQLYMAYMELDTNPALFTAINADTMEIYAESIPFDPGTAQDLSDRAVTIIRACDDGVLLPRVSMDTDFYICKWCDLKEWCDAQS